MFSWLSTHRFLQTYLMRKRTTFFCIEQGICYSLSNIRQTFKSFNVNVPSWCPNSGCKEERLIHTICVSTLWVIALHWKSSTVPLPTILDRVDEKDLILYTLQDKIHLFTHNCMEDPSADPDTLN